MNEREQFIRVWEREFPTTLKVLKAFPAAKSDFKPHERSRSARELAFVFSIEESVMQMVFKGDVPMGGKFPEAPAKYDDVVAAYEKAHHANAALLAGMRDADFQQIRTFGKLEKVPMIQILWFLLMDGVHHRGQFALYLRIAGAKVPSIYGPSGDEPWT